MAIETVRDVLWQTASEEPKPSPNVAQGSVADIADFYAFVSPDRPDTVTFIGTFVPREITPGGSGVSNFSDDVVIVVLRAIAGAIYPVIDSSFTPDPAASAAGDPTSYAFLSPERYQSSFPYVGRLYAAAIRRSPPTAAYTGIARLEGESFHNRAPVGKKWPENGQARR